MSATTRMAMGKRAWWKTAAVFVLLAAVMGALQWNWFAMPLERDEGEYAYAAWLTRTGKGVPYRDSFLQKPPMIVYTYALVEALVPGSDKAGFRVAGFLAALATAGLVWGLGRREFGGGAGVWAACLWMAFVQQYTLFNSVAANVEKFMVVPMLGAMAAVGAGERCPLRWGLAGTLAAAAVLYKPICAPVLVGYFLWRGGGTAGEWRGAWRWWGAAVLGGVAVLVATLGWFAWKGALGAMWECAVEYTGAYAKLSGHPLQGVVSWAAAFGTWKLGLIAGLTVAGALRCWRDGWKWAGVFALATGLAMSGLNGHYYLMALPFGAMLAGAGADRLPFRDGRWRQWGGAVLTVGLVVVLCGTGKERKGLVFSPRYLCRALYAGNPFPEAEGAGRAVASLCGEDGRVYVVGSEPEILWYARRKGVSRFAISYPLAIGTGYEGKYQTEALAALDETPPDVVVVARTRMGFLGDPEAYDGYLKEVAARTLGAGYRLAWSFDERQGGWVVGGTWAERAREGSTLGVLAKGG